jgi:Fic family protein
MEEPIFNVTVKSLDLVAKIVEMISDVQNSGEHAHNLYLRKVNRLRSIHSSNAIEGNTLTLQQVTDVIDGKHVLGSPKEIRETKNAYEAYEHLFEYDPYSAKDLLRAHGYMTSGLVNHPGHYRSGDVGVFSGKVPVHVAPPQQFVPQLISDLLKWAKKSTLHPIIKSSIVHFELEFIHPFIDGNGRTGRLWQSLILAKWKEAFAWVPIETIVYENQQGYYVALRKASRSGDCSGFIEFMLEIIAEALIKLPSRRLDGKLPKVFRDIIPDKSTDIIPDIIPDKSTDIIPDKSTDKAQNTNSNDLSKAELEFLHQIASYIEKNGEITSYTARLLTNKSADSTRKYLTYFVKLGLFKAVGKNKGRKYVLSDKVR